MAHLTPEHATCHTLLNPTVSEALQGMLLVAPVFPLRGTLYRLLTKSTTHTTFFQRLVLRPLAHPLLCAAYIRDDSNISEDCFQVLLAYLAANAAELRQLQCQDCAPARPGEASRPFQTGLPYTSSFRDRATPLQTGRRRSSGHGRLGCACRPSKRSRSSKISMKGFSRCSRNEKILFKLACARCL